MYSAWNAKEKLPTLARGQRQWGKYTEWNFRSNEADGGLLTFAWTLLCDDCGNQDAEQQPRIEIIECFRHSLK